MRRTHLRKHNNILKRLLIHVAGMNLGLLLRYMYGTGTPRGLQGTSLTLYFLILLMRQAACSEPPELVGAKVTTESLVTPLFQVFLCAHLIRSEIPKETSTPGC